MILVAWQNMISPHQAPLLNCLAARPEVERLLLIVEQDISEQRAAMGWQIPDMPDVEVMVSPQFSELDALKPLLLKSEHLVSGFCQGLYGNWIKANIPQFFLYSELAKSDSALRHWLNRFRYRRFYRQIQTQVQGIFAIGAQCPIWLKDTVKIPAELILPFGYFLNAAQPHSNRINDRASTDSGALFVGRLEPVKGIIELLDAYLQANANWPLTIVGDGSLRERVEEKAAGAETITVTGSLPQAEILSLLGEYQCMLLPNQKEEGWGFVINEALMNGTPVYCSELTGARNVIHNAPHCQVFAADQIAQMVTQVGVLIMDGWSAEQRVGLQDWYNQHLSVDVAVDYMLDVITQNTDTKMGDKHLGWL